MNEAYLRVYKNKGASGVDGVTIEELKQYLTRMSYESASEQENTNHKLP